MAIDDAEPVAAEQPLGAGDGYEHLSDIRRWTRPAATRSADSKPGTNQLRVRLAANVPETVFTAKCPGYSLEPRIPGLLRRATGARVAFAAVYEWTKDDGEILGVGVDDDGSVEIRGRAGTAVVRFDDKVRWWKRSG